MTDSEAPDVDSPETQEDEAPPACVMSFNASDPSGAGGLAGDVATIAAMGAHALPVVTSIVLRDMTLENPIRAIREISHDITCKRRVRLANGREMTALEIQSEYLSRALKYAERRELSPLEKQALDMWEHCLT